MSDPVDLLLITSNRREYVEKSVRTLFDDPAEFRLYWWDNHSTDETPDVVASLCDKRLVERHLSPVNVLQNFPTRWFLERARSDVVGKIDDDILLPAGWTERIAQMVRSEPRYGMLGCWIYMPEDWREEKASQNFVQLDDRIVFRTTSIAGHSFLSRGDYLRQYLRDNLPGLPVDRAQMTFDGLINGYPVPLILAHNMDDPRSPHCQLRNPGFPREQASFTMKRLGFESPEEFAKWIAADALYRQVTPIEKQIRRDKLQRDRTLRGRLRRKLWTRLGLLRR
jgi:glycosyltransferase involved in cell wall biosynthesis